VPDSRDRLPFEPKRKQPKPAKSEPTKPASSKSASTAAPARPSGAVRGASKDDVSLSAIPKEVSNRMVRRMALLSGVPTGAGIASFGVAYLIVVNDWFELPTYAVVLVSMGLFGLGVLGLSYGILSASWDEQRVGTLVGWEEFRRNLDRLISSWRNARREARAAKNE